jgi:hypothetical protein
VESDIRYYQRRVREEQAAARRAVTSAARDRRLQLVDLYLQRLQALETQGAFAEHSLASAIKTSVDRSAFAWSSPAETATS